MYFAEIDNDNKVIRVIVAEQDFINSISGKWVQTDLNGISPKNYAGIGYSWDEERNAFIPDKPYNSWNFNEETCLWNAPIEKPNDDQFYKWNEDSLSWDLK